MITIRILGGLASQLAKYNFGYMLAKAKNVPLCLDLGDYYDGYYRRFLLSELDGIPDCDICYGYNDEEYIKAENGNDLIRAYEDDNCKNIYIYKEGGIIGSSMLNIRNLL